MDTRGFMPAVVAVWCSKTTWATTCSAPAGERRSVPPNRNLRTIEWCLEESPCGEPDRCACRMALSLTGSAINQQNGKYPMRTIRTQTVSNIDHPAVLGMSFTIRYADARPIPSRLAISVGVTPCRKRSMTAVA